MKGKPAYCLGLLAAGIMLSGLVLSSCTRSRQAAPNVVLVVVDALRPDFLGCYGYGRPTSPNIDRIARGGIVFENAVAHAPWTKTSFSTFLTSLYPFQHGVVGWESVMPDSVLTLPEVLRDAGYSTMAVINMLGITGEFKVTKGVDKLSEADKDERDAFGTSADAIELMKSAPKPFFIMIHYFDTHRPYRVPVEYVDLIRKPGDPDPFSAQSTDGTREGERPPQEITDRERVLYGGCIRYVDDAVGKILKYLDEAGLSRETVFILTADHGEAFWEHGAMAHGSNLYDEAIKVPLIIDYPRKYGRPRRLDAQVRHIDLLPTILELAGASDTRRREGTSLCPLIETGKRQAGPARLLPQDAALCESSLKKTPDSKCIRTNDLKLIVEPATALCELYDLRADPKENINLWGTGSAAADSFFRLIDRVPGTSLNGWRVALTGEPTGAVEVDVTLAGGGRLTGVHKVSAPGAMALDIPDDSTSLSIRARPKGLQVLLFDTQPRDARVTFKVSAGGPNGPSAVNVGKIGGRPIGERFTLETQQAAGLPDAFGQFRTRRAAGVHIWWLPGEEMREPGERAVLSPEAKKRLRALGYVQ
jgi:arylsulfatase A-like enzyme